MSRVDNQEAFRLVRLEIIEIFQTNIKLKEAHVVLSSTDKYNTIVFCQYM
jgi:hypothetical protein